MNLQRLCGWPHFLIYLFIASFCWTWSWHCFKLFLNSDYPYLTEHFRERHYLCEEGHCATEQFTHAFRSEIDYKAHKAAFHSKNRAEARQNRHIDLQFNYAPRQQRRNEGQRQLSVQTNCWRWVLLHSVFCEVMGGWVGLIRSSQYQS